MDPQIAPIDCACVIHGDAYSWEYVERLYNMLSRHINPGVRLHVYTEAHRIVPAPMIKHELEDWGIAGPKKSWWYKMQLFNATNFSGRLLYFDLDVVITRNLNWIYQNPTNNFWAVRDFKYLWKPTFYGINSSVMYWDTIKYAYIWEKFKQQDLSYIMKKYHGDQDYITDAIPINERSFFDPNKVQSWRWQCVDGGYDFRKRQHIQPGSGTNLLSTTNIMVFHGHPKPDQISDPVIQQHWQ